MYLTMCRSSSAILRLFRSLININLFVLSSPFIFCINFVEHIVHYLAAYFKNESDSRLTIGLPNDNSYVIID